jgi:nucleoside-diphosphate-sugar epimerase
MNDLAADFMRGKCLVVFGAGYVGGALAARAVQAGAEVHALTRNATRAAELTAIGVRTVVADLADPATWTRQLPTNVDGVVNTVSSGGGGLEGYRRSYVDGAQAIRAWGEAQSRDRAFLLYTSSTSVYAQDGGVTVDESAAVGATDERTNLLLEAEAIALAWKGGASVLRLAGIYGPGRHYLLDALRSGAEELSGRGDYRLNLIHRDDAVGALWSALAQPEAARGQIFNVADDGAATRAEVVEWLAARLGRPPPRFDGGPAIGRRARTPDRLISNQKLRTTLNWRPVYPSFREGYAALF